ncbi:bifunctional 4-hydroxy-2-oxoglutarate aldolase/2-dehydro-3-deoxy-phosphogluconate aldolase [Bacillus timonensis]|uniref:Bifunctional 4-hydroxy-2-oxoglutarate aldolase/2-dehydro-3-deoxy-phosphogluconate aldolase n=1 Tax=Bacillus timonensis TaxID=1033734 RepID=A0A4V3V7J0_9BACI|nr:bifunctional 4-hydroxy-2-oxoglutarate aldolase/2-dehydro-3-deoxy-phosphogluconate aldolase [Bacillus timonensis]THE11603.1 bifunctional 4-hydroxy-2-oxoglutarate aldolase/2-dehydro-3-deoxy-phosphogluconate aldolase [Bacillus timonensis]
MSHSNLSNLLDSGVIAVVRKVSREKVTQVVSSLIAGGVTGIEITIDSEDALGAIREVKDIFGEKAVIGAGTVLNSQSAEMAIEAGAEFIFAPTLHKGTIEVTKGYKKIVIPGVFTPTEILQAYEWGADVVKVFPASSLGPDFIKQIRGPLGHIPMMPTGGIDLENTEDFIAAGSVAVGVGGALLRKDLIDNNQWEPLTSLAQQFVQLVRKARRNEVILEKNEKKP